MTDTRTPDARLREAGDAVERITAEMLRVLDARWSKSSKRDWINGPLRSDLNGALRAALTGDADTPEPGLSLADAALYERIDGLLDEHAAADAKAYHAAHCATHPVEAPHD